MDIKDVVEAIGTITKIADLAKYPVMPSAGHYNVFFTIHDETINKIKVMQCGELDVYSMTVKQIVDSVKSVGSSILDQILQRVDFLIAANHPKVLQRSHEIEECRKTVWASHKSNVQCALSKMGLLLHSLPIKIRQHLCRQTDPPSLRQVLDECHAEVEGILSRMMEGGSFSNMLCSETFLS